MRSVIIGALLALLFLGTSFFVLDRSVDQDIAYSTAPPRSDEGGLANIARPPASDRISNPSPHSEEILRAEADAYLDGLPRSDVRFNRLDRVPYGEPRKITVVITPPDTKVSTATLFKRDGTIEVHEIPLATQVEVELDSLDQGVEIRPDEPRRILVRPNRPVELTWQLTAKRTEAFTLELTLTNRVSIDGRELVDRNPFKRKFEVEVGTFQRAAIWIEELDPIWKLLAGILSFVGVWALLKPHVDRLRGKPPEKPGEKKNSGKGKQGEQPPKDGSTSHNNEGPPPKPLE